jgi:pyrimidine operon attenuation protein/uracil phosphoribosyltransferase
MAYQIYEANVDEAVIILAGIDGGGMALSLRIQRILEEITDAEIRLCTVKMDKSNPLKSGVQTTLQADQYANQSVVLIDDVLSSGSTLIYGVHHFIKTPLKQLKTAVLIDRNFKRYPVKADFKGLSLSTSMQEHVRVDLNSESNVVYLD